MLHSTTQNLKSNFHCQVKKNVSGKMNWLVLAMSFFEQAEECALEQEARIKEREMEVRFREMEDTHEERMLSFFAALMGRPYTCRISLIVL